MAAGPAHGGFQEGIALVMDNCTLDHCVFGDERFHSPGSHHPVDDREDDTEDDYSERGSRVPHPTGQ